MFLCKNTFNVLVVLHVVLAENIYVHIYIYGSKVITRPCVFIDFEKFLILTSTFDFGLDFKQILKYFMKS